ncbi:MAG TPA: hypothetical protein VHU44_05895 [Acidobacteriaceae bacterium]|nr:hypothetical protein [Acidobacteriaceae bacterium]
MLTPCKSLSVGEPAYPVGCLGASEELPVLRDLPSRRKLTRINDLTRHVRVFLLLLLSPSGILAAQSPAPASINASPTPGQTALPTANPARPTFTNPADLPPAGYLQFEQGLVQAGASPGLDSQFSIGQVTKIAVAPRLMLEFVSQPFAYSSAAQQTSRDAGDLDLAVQAVVVEKSGHRPTIAVNYQNVVRSGSAPNLDVGSSTRSAVLLISGDIGLTHYDTNYIVSEQTLPNLPQPSLRRAQFGQTICLSHPLFAAHTGSRLSLSGELWHETQPLPTADRRNRPVARANAVGALAALSYAFAPNLVADTALNRGLTSTSTTWQFLAGFTYLLPHRLW